MVQSRIDRFLKSKLYKNFILSFFLPTIDVKCAPILIDKINHLSDNTKTKLPYHIAKTKDGRQRSNFNNREFFRIVDAVYRDYHNLKIIISYRTGSIQLTIKERRNRYTVKIEKDPGNKMSNEIDDIERTADWFCKHVDDVECGTWRVPPININENFHTYYFSESDLEGFKESMYTLENDPNYSWVNPPRYEVTKNKTYKSYQGKLLFWLGFIPNLFFKVILLKIVRAILRTTWRTFTFPIKFLSILSIFVYYEIINIDISLPKWMINIYDWATGLIPFL